MSSASPCGRPSTMSIRTTSSASPACATRMAAVAPTNPLPTMVTRTRRLPTHKVEEAILRGEHALPRGPKGPARGELEAGGDRGRGPDPCLLEHQREVVRAGGRSHRFLDGDQSVLHQAQQGLIERL